MEQGQAHDRLNAAVSAHLAVAIEAQAALAQVVDLSAHYQADIGTGRLVLGGRPLSVVLLGTVAKESNTWLWSWANQGFAPDIAAIAPVRQVADRGAAWGLPELSTPVFGLAGVVDTGLGAGASVALLACAILGAVGFYAADYGAGVAFFGIVDPSVRRPEPDGAGFTRHLRTAAEIAPGQGRSQLLTYAGVHNLRVRSAGTGLEVFLPSGDRILVEFDAQERPVRIGAAPTVPLG